MNIFKLHEGKIYEIEYTGNNYSLMQDCIKEKKLIAVYNIKTLKKYKRKYKIPIFNEPTRQWGERKYTHFLDYFRDVTFDIVNQKDTYTISENIKMINGQIKDCTYLYKENFQGCIFNGLKLKEKVFKNCTFNLCFFGKKNEAKFIDCKFNDCFYRSQGEYKKMEEI